MIKQVSFSVPHALVPVMEDGRMVLYQWGKRKGEDTNLDSPATGWARYSSFHYWLRYQPRMCLIPALAFSEKGKFLHPHWFELPEGAFLLGLKVVRAEKSFVYIVTNPPEGFIGEIHPMMPLLVDKDMMPVEVEINDLYGLSSHPSALSKTAYVPAYL